MTEHEDLYAVFQARFVRYVAWVGILMFVVGTVVVVALAPGSGGEGYAAGNIIGICLVMAAGCLFLWRQATVRAVVDSHGITVRNLLTVRTFAWQQVVAVTFRSGDPWVMLEISDGTTFPMMAVQRADGEHARRQAERLRTLVARHGEAPDPTAERPA